MSLVISIIFVIALVVFFGWLLKLPLLWNTHAPYTV
jgi:hypothetical protein